MEDNDSKVNRILLILCFANLSVVLAHRHVIGEQPLSKIAIHKATFALDIRAVLKANPSLLGPKVTIYSIFFFI